MIQAGLPIAQFGGDAEADGGSPLGRGDRQLAGAARAGRRARRDHAVELPAEPDRRQGRPRPRRRLHRGAEAERGGAAQRLHPRRGDRGRRPAGRRLQPRHRHRAGRRRGDRRPPRRRHGLLHRLDPRRPPRLRAGLGDGQAGRDGARRQVAERDPRRRRPEQGRARRRRQVLPQLGPDLQRPDPDAGAAREAGRSRGRSPQARPRAFTPGDPFEDSTRLGPLVSEAQRERVRGYIEKGEAEGAKLVTGGAERARGSRQAATSSAPPSSPT